MPEQSKLDSLLNIQGDTNLGANRLDVALSGLGSPAPTESEPARPNGAGDSIVQTFDPEGMGYDFSSAKSAGLGPDETGHFPSRDPRTGLILKGAKHPTFNKTLEAEKELGFKIQKGKDGRYYSQKDPALVSAEGHLPSPLKESNPFKTIGKAAFSAIAHQIPSGIAATTGAAQSALSDFGARITPSANPLIPFELTPSTKEVNTAITNKAIEVAQEFRQEGVKYTEGLINSLDKIEGPLDAVNWVAYAVGQAAGQIPAAVGTFGMSSFLLETGEIYMGALEQIAQEKGLTMEQVIEQGLDDPASAMAYGTAAAALERIGAGKVIKAVKKSGFISDLKRRALSVIKSGAWEGVTEGAQSVIEQVGSARGAGKSFSDALKNIDPKDIVESSAQGFFGGGGISSIAHGANMLRQQITKPKGEEVAPVKKETVKEAPEKVVSEKEVPRETTAIPSFEIDGKSVSTEDIKKAIADNDIIESVRKGETDMKIENEPELAKELESRIKQTEPIQPIKKEDTLEQEAVEKDRPLESVSEPQNPIAKKLIQQGKDKVSQTDIITELSKHSDEQLQAALDELKSLPRPKITGDPTKDTEAQRPIFARDILTQALAPIETSIAEDVPQPRRLIEETRGRAATVENLQKEAKKFKNPEEFKALGFEAIQKELFGIENGDIVDIPVKDIKIKFKEDLKNAQEAARKQDITEKTPPVEVSFNINTGKFTLQDGHNRFVAAKRQGIPLKAKVMFTEGNIEDMAQIIKERTGQSIEQIFEGSKETKKPQVKSLAQLEEENKATLPKIKTEKVFLNPKQNIPSEQLQKADPFLEKIENLPVQEVKIADILPTQTNLNIDNLKKVEDVDKRPVLIKYKDQLYINDGHHRIANDILKGEENVEAHLFDLDKELSKKPEVKETAPKKETKAPEEPKTTALKKEEIKEIRKDFGIEEEVEKADAQKWETVLQGAKDNKADEQAVVVAKDVIKNPRVITNEEHASFVLKTAKLQNQYEEQLNDAEKALEKGNEEEATRHQNLANEVLEDIETLTKAADFSGREAGRALNIRKFRLSRENYSLAKLTQRAKLAKNEDLTKEESLKIKGFAEKIKTQQQKINTLEKEIQKLEENRAKLEAQKEVEARAKRQGKRRNKARLTEVRTDLKQQMADLGYRVNDITGLTFEVAQIISKLASTYIEEGATNLKQVVESVKKDIPELTDKDIFDSFGGRIASTKKKVISDAQKRVNELQKQARLQGQIEDAHNNIFDPKKKKPVSSEEVKKLTDELNKLRDSAYKTIEDDKRLNDTLLKINNVQDQIEQGFRNIKAKRKEDPEAIKEAKKDLSEIRRLMETNDKIANLQDQIKTGNFIIPEHKQAVVKSAELRDAKIELEKTRKQANELIHNMQARTFRERVIDIVTLPRSILATADMSYALRQAVWLSARRPVTAIRTFSKAFQAFFNENKAIAIDLAIKEHPNHKEREKAGLFMASLENISFTEREEVFVSNLAEKIPVFGKIVKASNRNMTTGLNLMRVAAFDSFLEANPNATDAELKAWADYVNVASGRGNLGRFNAVANELSTVLFAPKFTASRIQTPFKLLQNWKNPLVRKEIAKDMAAFVGMGMTALTLASLAGFDVGDDPEDSDFGKIVSDDTRVDFWGGFIQPARLMLGVGLKTLDALGIREMEKPRNIYDMVGRFSMYKLAPAITIPIELVEGKTVIGEDVTPIETLGRNLMPLVLQDVKEVYDNSQNILKTATVGALAFAGASVGEHAPRGPLGKEKRESKSIRAKEKEKKQDALLLVENYKKLGDFKAFPAKQNEDQKSFKENLRKTDREMFHAFSRELNKARVSQKLTDIEKGVIRLEDSVQAKWVIEQIAKKKGDEKKQLYRDYLDKRLITDNVFFHMREQGFKIPK